MEIFRARFDHEARADLDGAWPTLVVVAINDEPEREHSVVEPAAGGALQVRSYEPRFEIDVRAGVRRADRGRDDRVDIVDAEAGRDQLLAGRVERADL